MLQGVFTGGTSHFVHADAPDDAKVAETYISGHYADVTDTGPGGTTTFGGVSGSTMRTLGLWIHTALEIS